MGVFFWPISGFWVFLICGWPTRSQGATLFAATVCCRLLDSCTSPRVRASPGPFGDPPPRLAEMRGALQRFYTQKKKNIYIYMAITSISGPNKGQNFNFPQLYTKKWPRNKKKHTHTLGVGGFTFQCFVFSLIFAFSCLSFLSFPVLLGFLKPKSGPSNMSIRAAEPKRPKHFSAQQVVFLLASSRKSTEKCREGALFSTVCILGAL